jgi:putative RNA 2'-phosphotransferase
MEVRDGKRKRTFDTTDRISTGKFIALILRHNPSVIGITLDEHGWADADELISKLGITRSFLEEIVRLNNKQRYTFNEDGKRIRANQGHSVDVDVELEKAVPPSVLYHGTGEKFVASIDETGLLPKSRLYVHLSSDYNTAVTVGSRHGRPVVYTVDTERMVKDGFVFFLSRNGVWLTKRVPVEYLKKNSPGES